MVYDTPQPGSLKRKRRRREDKPAISARLCLDTGLKGDAGVISDDLLRDLYPGRSYADHAELYIALAPWSPSVSLSGSTWTVLPFRIASPDDRQLPPSTIRYPASALGTQSFLQAFQALYPNRALRQNAVVEVRVSDVVPIPLATVFVSVDANALQKLDAVHKRHGGGSMHANGHTGRKIGKRRENVLSEEDDPAFSIEERRKQLVQDALEHVRVIHTADWIPFPLTHPITYASAPPAKILGCEPVSQGVLVPSSRVVIVPTADQRHSVHNGRQLLIFERLSEDTGEDQDASETFYSATEENSPVKPIVTSKSTTDFSNTDDLFDSSTEESNLSDDSDDMISLSRPLLTGQPSGRSSAMTSVTPRPFGTRTGVSTPGSVFSNATATTIRGGQHSRSKVFQTRGLMEMIHNDLLHPRPAADEDNEARVYVDATALARLGCFSGDWVRIEPAESHALPSLSAFGLFDGVGTPAWRPVKVYSLPENMSKRPQRYQVNPRLERRASISSVVTNAPSSSMLYLSPILLANLKYAENVSLAPLSLGKRVGQRPPASSATVRLPPTASEVTLRKIVTPLSTERALNHALFANLKDHFENERRIIKPGDLIAIPFDQSLGRSVYDGDVEKDTSAGNDLLSRWNAQDAKEKSCGTTAVAWFSIEHVIAQADGDEPNETVDTWGGAVAIDPTKMTMRQSGDDRRQLPPASSNPWPYYLGVRNHPAKPLDSIASPSSLQKPPQRSQSTTYRRLRDLIAVSTSPRAVHLGLPPLAVLMKSTQRTIGKAYTVREVCADLGLHYFDIDAYDVISESGSGFDTQAQGLFEARCSRALDCGSAFTALCIRHLETFNSDRVATSLKSVLQGCRVLVATTTDVDKLPDSVRGLFTHELEMSAPDEGEREGTLRNITNEVGVPLASDIDLASIAVKTAALVAGDLVDVVDRALVARNVRLDALASSLSSLAGDAIMMKDLTISGGAAATSLLPADFDSAVDFARKNFADAIGAPKIPNVQWSDVGGLTHVKDAVAETIQLPLSRPELFAQGLKKRSGILFYGPPGTGKTLLAKAIATEFSLNFFSVKGPELLNMYIGESEANVRRVFARARDARPCVVFFDELDSVAPKRGNQGDSGGVMDRIVSQLLAELDGMSNDEQAGGGVFVIGATNRPDLLDPALLRPGRFDKMLYLGISDSHEKQATILQALTRKFSLDASLSLPRIASSLPFTFTGADLYALCSDAMLKAITRSSQLVDRNIAAINHDRTAIGQGKISVANYFDHYATEHDTDVSVTEADFEAARKELVPSVSLDELRHYERVRDTFEGATGKGSRATTADAPVSKLSSHITPNSPRPPHLPSPSRQVNGGHRYSRDKIPTLNGHTRLPAAPGQPQGYAASHVRGDSSDDDFVVRTDQMDLTDHSRAQETKAMRPPLPSSRSSKGKGKGKAKRSEAVQGGEAEVHGEDLYD